MRLQGFFGSGYFVEDKETDAPNYLRTLERKKVLSNIEQLGLLSAAEKAGLSLSKVTRSPPQLHLQVYADLQGRLLHCQEKGVSEGKRAWGLLSAAQQA